MANGYVRYGNSIHLDGFQILDFCIENAISLESLRDLNLGRKVFLTGNDTNAGYLRENVWDGTRWRAAAYLDDLTSFKDEDFNKLKEKVDTLIGDGVDMDGIIESWKEVEAFLAGISDKKDLVTLLDDKVSKSEGGTITGNITVKGLSFFNQRLSMREGAIIDFFKADGNIAGILGPYSANNYALSWYDGSSWNTLLHEGNVGEYTAGDSDKLGGYDANTYLRASKNDSFDFNSPFYETNRPAIVRFGINANMPNVDLEYGHILHVAAGYDTAWELAAGYNQRSPLMFRCGTWKADGSGTIHNEGKWKTIAFTDSTVEAANRLANKVSLWGNEFDGTQSLNGNIHMPNGSALYFITTTQEYIAAVNMASDNVLTFGNGTNFSTRNLNTRVDGYNIYFRTGAKQTAMTITDGGNIEIAGANNVYTRKLAVGIGGAHIIATTTSIPVLGKPAKGSLLVGSVHYGLQIGTDTNSEASFIQAQRFDSADAKALNLNPLGGAVNIASADASTNVLGELKLGSGTIGYINMVGSGVNYLWAANTIHIGLSTVGGRSGDNATLTIKNDSIHSGFRNNAVSLGTSSRRWSNVYSADGNFLGRVLIGSNIDDKNFKLNVAGAVKITRSNDVTTYLGITVSDVLTTFDGVDTVDGYMRYSFQSHGTELLRLGSTSYFRTLVGFDKLATFNGGALIPTGQKLTIGSVTFEEDATGRVKVDGDMYATGTLASGGKAKEGTGTGSGSANVRDFELPADRKTTYDCDHLLKSKNVIVQVFEKAIQNNIEVWEMILTDVTIVTEDRVTVTFGRPTTKVHKVHIIGGNVS